jgi:ATP/maltotriose-dependent transcriptional regulator MalT/DNA-binding SARP family transcriptional activator
METINQHITRTRIAIPRKRSDLVSRQRLLDALDVLLEKKIIIVTAPAGYGKTSLLIDFADDLALPVCWYSLDSLDQNIFRFLEYFIAAIQYQFPKFDTSVLNLLDASYQQGMDIDSLVTTLVNEIYEEITEHFIIILDDYHLVENNVQINQFLSRFLQNVEENCHVVFSSRTLLSLPDLPLLVARGMVGGLSFEDLAFNLQEVQELFFDNHKIVLSTKEAQNLYMQTEGWITGLLLTAQTSIARLQEQGKNLRASGVNINDYFELIFDAQPPEIQQFLLYTSLLEDYNFNLVNQTIAKLFPNLGKNYKAHANYLAKANIFIQSVGDDGLSLRYHHLFLDFLHQKLQIEQWDVYQQLQEIIAAYYEKSQQWEKAFQIYKKENLHDKQIALLENAGLPLMSSGRFGVLHQWMMEIPEKEILENPALCSLMGTILSMTGDIKNSLAYLSRALQYLNPVTDPALTARTLARKAAALRVLGHYSEAIQVAQQALEIINDDLSLRAIRAEAYKTSGGCYFDMGSLSLSLEYLQLALDDFTFLKKDTDIAIVSLELGTVNYSLGNYEKAKKFYQFDVDYWEKIGNHAWLSNVLNNLGVLQHLGGEIENAITNLENALRYARLTKYYRVEAAVLSGIGDLYVDLGALEEAANIYQQSLDIGIRINAKYIMVYAYCALAFIALAQNQLTPAYENLQKSRMIAQEMDSAFEIQLTSFMEGLCYFKEKQYQNALDLFSKSLDFFVANHYTTYIARSALYTALSYAALKDIPGMRKTTHLMEKYVNIPENKFAILPSASREYKMVISMSQSIPESTEFTQWLKTLEDFRQKIPQYRRKIRRKTHLVPFAPAHLEIISLGDMKVKYNDKWLTNSDWQTQSARDFFFLILSQPEGLTKEEIGLLLWPEDSEQELKFHFKNAVYRVRHAIGKESILLDNDRYRFNTDLDYQFDVSAFQKEVAAIKKAFHWSNQLDHYQKAAALYRGIYLPHLDMAWIAIEREKLHLMYITMMIEMSHSAFQQEDFSLAIDIAQQTMKVDPCQEEVYRIAMQAQAANGNRGEVARVYKQCEKVLQQELDAPPSQKTRRLYQSLMKL